MQHPHPHPSHPSHPPSASSICIRMQTPQHPPSLNEQTHHNHLRIYIGFESATRSICMQNPQHPHAKPAACACKTRSMCMQNPQHPHAKSGNSLLE
jgi:hypothetical protein